MGGVLVLGEMKNMNMLLLLLMVMTDQERAVAVFHLD
jgi:hypothetical protein